MNAGVEVGGPPKGSLVGIKYPYKYPRGLDLRPGEEFHDKLLDRVRELLWESHRVISTRYDSWRKIDETLTTYIPTDEAEQKEKAKDPRKPISVVVPKSLAILDTLQANYVATFLERPYFRYRGYGAEDTLKAILLEQVIDFQCVKNKVALKLMTMWRDGFAYGMGVTTPIWVKKFGKRMSLEPEGYIAGDGSFVQTGEKRLVTNQLLFEGNALKQIDVYKYLPDPNVSPEDTQEGEFVGWCVREAYTAILTDEQRGDDGLFNVKYIKHIDGRSIMFRATTAERNAMYDRPYGDRQYGSDVVSRQQELNQQVDRIYVHVNLIPREWKLGGSEKPQKWLFQIAGDEIIVGLEPIPAHHNMFPVAVNSPMFDGHSSTPLGMLETIYPLQVIENWYLNSQVANARKTLNNTFLVDPSLVRWDDMTNSIPGGLFRLRKRAFGRGKEALDGAVKQLEVKDVTQHNMANLMLIGNLMDQTSGTPEALQGVLRSGPERLSAQEARDTRMSALSRVALMAQATSTMAMEDIAMMFAYHTQQFMSRDVYVGITGPSEALLRDEYGLEDRVKVTPFDTIVDFDIVPSDASQTGGEFADIWVTLLQIISQSPELLAQFDTVRILKHIARISGAKDIEAFVKRGPANVKVAGQEEIESERDKGNIVAAPEA